MTKTVEPHRKVLCLKRPYLHINAIRSVNIPCQSNMTLRYHDPLLQTHGTCDMTVTRVCKGLLVDLTHFHNQSQHDDTKHNEP